MFSITMATKILLSLPLLMTIVLSNGKSIEGSKRRRQLRGNNLQQRNLRPDNSVICLTAQQCQDKYLSLYPGGTQFYTSNFPTKGCFLKTSNNKYFFGTGGSVDDMSIVDLTGVQERVYCDAPPTDEPSASPITNSPTSASPTSLAPVITTQPPVIADTGNSTEDLVSDWPTYSPTAGSDNKDTESGAIEEETEGEEPIIAEGFPTQPPVVAEAEEETGSPTVLAVEEEESGAPTESETSEATVGEEDIKSDLIPQAPPKQEPVIDNDDIGWLIIPDPTKMPDPTPSPTPAPSVKAVTSNPTVSVVVEEPVVDDSSPGTTSPPVDAVLDTPFPTLSPITDAPTVTAPPAEDTLEEVKSTTQEDEGEVGEVLTSEDFNDPNVDFLQNNLDVADEPVGGSTPLYIIVTVFVAGFMLVALYVAKTRRGRRLALEREMAAAALEEEPNIEEFPVYIEVENKTSESIKSTSEDENETLAKTLLRGLGLAPDGSQTDPSASVTASRVSALTQPIPPLFDDATSVGTQSTAAQTPARSSSQNSNSLQASSARDGGELSVFEESRLDPISEASQSNYASQSNGSSSSDLRSQNEKAMTTPWDTLCGAYGGDLTSTGYYSNSKQSESTYYNSENDVSTQDDDEQTAPVKNTSKFRSFVRRSVHRV